LDRSKNHCQTYRKRTFDLVVIGGGITGGSGIAWMLPLAGLKVPLVEKNDFGIWKQ